MEMKDPEARRRLREMLEFQIREKQSSHGTRDGARQMRTPVGQKPPVHNATLLNPNGLNQQILPPLNMN